MNYKLNYYNFLIKYFGLNYFLKICLNKVLNRVSEKSSIRKREALYLIFKDYENINFNGQYYVSHNGIKSYLRPDDSDPLVFKQIFIDKEYAYVLKFFTNEFKHDPEIIIDAGANVGYTSQFFNLEIVNPKIIALEPDLENFHQLQLNSQQFEDTRAVNLALWYRTTSVTIHDSFRDGSSWSLNVKEIESNGEPNALTLNEILSQYSLERIDILKIDVEGAEAEIFRKDDDLDKVLLKTKLIAIEVHEEFIEEKVIVERLHSRNFTTSKSGELIVGINKNYGK